MLRRIPLRLSKIIEQETLIFPRTVDTVTKLPEVTTSNANAPAVEDSPIPVPKQETEVDDWDSVGEAWRSTNKMAPEKGFTYKGNEPTMFGDWQHKGRATDF